MPDGTAIDASSLEGYITTAPSPQNAVDLFAGTWSSHIPLPGVTSGPLPLFNDDRVRWAIDQLGGIDGLRVLELGPLEAGHTYQLLAAGAEVVAVEAQGKAYLKCLIAKELLGMNEARFLLGDFMEYLRGTTDHYDVCFASGVLYHMSNPVETLALAAEAADNLFLWTHYYDEDICQGSERVRPHFVREPVPSVYEGFEHTLHPQDYQDGVQLKGFCGGTAHSSNWLSRDDLIGGLEHFGWTVLGVSFDDPTHENGPALALAASRTKPAG
ncbi:MAG TPA: DUF1698 domain-containing protein [Acidimicrobiales bacterium]